MNEYENIINLPHPKSAIRQQMPISDRAAQFAPFAALTGHSEAIKETARVTAERIELDEQEKVFLNRRLCFLKNQICDKFEVSITYFKPDTKKQGGVYVTAKGTVQKINELDKVIVLRNGAEIPIDDILSIEGDF